ncbi:Uncharacterised protein [Chryseobacterium carnipullorum]|uniref:Uncharacterized protein n=2 Tax=Chryseobacterium carnipullorum TaxID=1124835 RepID=A0A376DXI4_CHRCU|nr:Uncharacterised protein [Chryseobacterium carnipullorum]
MIIFMYSIGNTIFFKKGKGNQFHKKRECQKQSLFNNSMVCLTSKKDTPTEILDFTGMKSTNHLSIHNNEIRSYQRWLISCKTTISLLPLCRIDFKLNILQ